MDNNTTPNTNQGGTPPMSGANTGAPMHHSHKGLVWSLIIIIIIILAAIFILREADTVYDDSDTVNVQTTTDTETLDNASDDLGSIETDINSLDFDQMDTQLQ